MTSFHWYMQFYAIPVPSGGHWYGQPTQIRSTWACIHLPAHHWCKTCTLRCYVCYPLYSMTAFLMHFIETICMPCVTTAMQQCSFDYYLIINLYYLMNMTWYNVTLTLIIYRTTHLYPKTTTRKAVPITAVHDASMHSPCSDQLSQLSEDGKDAIQGEVTSPTNTSTLQCISVTSDKEYVVKNHDIADFR